MPREYRLLSALEGTDIPHATPLALCVDADILGGDVLRNVGS
jgi:aminoglycoside phosphotransferase (APT) family kinase protein